MKAVYRIQRRAYNAGEEESRVSTNALAEALNILPPSVTEMARRMAEAGLVDYRRYYGVRLTPEGERVALKVIRRHRLIELYLVEQLGYALHEVHDEAENLEHAVSDRFVDAIAGKLDHPTVDPHGDPIPSHDGRIITPDWVPLSDLVAGQSGRVSRYTAHDDDMLQHIIDKGFEMGAVVTVQAVDPFDGPLSVTVGGAAQIIGRGVARCIMVDTGDTL